MLDPPLLEGVPRERETIRCVNGTWVGDDLVFETALLRDGIALAEPSGEHLLRYEDVGHSFRCRVTATNALESVIAESSPVVALPLGPILGTPGADRLVGTFHSDAIRGFAGSDVPRGLQGPDSAPRRTGKRCAPGRPGADVLLGSAGADRFAARDGFADTISCGGGVDLVTADHRDHVGSDCERVEYGAAKA